MFADNIEATSLPHIWKIIAQRLRRLSKIEIQLDSEMTHAHDTATCLADLR